MRLSSIHSIVRIRQPDTDSVDDHATELASASRDGHIQHLPMAIGKMELLDGVVHRRGAAGDGEQPLPPADQLEIRPSFHHRREGSPPFCADIERFAGGEGSEGTEVAAAEEDGGAVDDHSAGAHPKLPN